MLKGYESAAGLGIFFLNVRRAVIIVMSRGPKQLRSVWDRESDV